MEILEQTRVRLHQQLLRKELPAHQVKRHSVFLDNATSIGILFDATVLKERNTVLKFAEKWKSKGKQVHLLGYFNEKLKSDDYSFKHFDKKKLDWVYRPKTEEATDFANRSFDLFINLSKRSVLPLDYIAAHSRARFRVGPYTENTFCYDLMVELNPDKGLAAFLDQVLHYLEKIQPQRMIAVV